MPTISDTWKSSDRLLQIIILIAVLLVGALLGGGSWALIKNTPDQTQIVLPLLVIGGVLSLLIVLALVSVFFQTLGLANPGQALALPEGSVRAVIALGLIVLFAILAIYLYGSIAARPAGAANQVADDFAKQLLTIMGTLVTAVASFYFGANTVASAHKAAREGSEAPDPVIQSVKPDKLSLGESSDSFAIAGDNLNVITNVRLERDGEDPVNVGGVQSNAHAVTGKLAIPADEKFLGKWNVVVSDAGEKLRAVLKNGFEVTKKG